MPGHGIVEGNLMADKLTMNARVRERHVERRASLVNFMGDCERDANEVWHGVMERRTAKSNNFEYRNRSTFCWRGYGDMKNN